LRACKASGHAGTGKTKGKIRTFWRRWINKRTGDGKVKGDIVCAAVSVLFRTAISILSGRNGITIRFGAPEKGQLWLEADYKAEGKDFLSTAGVFLIEGLKSVAQEYPKNCKITIRRN
jgi:uncharacterized protein